MKRTNPIRNYNKIFNFTSIVLTWKLIVLKLQDIISNRVKKIIKKLLFYRKWDAVTLHTLFLISLIFIFLLLGSVLFLAGEKVRSEKYEIANVRYPSKTERNINKLVSNQPMKEMIPLIAEEDKMTAAYLVAIAKKESNWGKYSPKKHGRNCYNYWGYRGRENPTLSGYSCFGSPEEAVSVVGNRIKELTSQNIDTPREMVIWKCGASCANFDSYSVRKWIADVDFYFQKVYN